jgi:DNA-binding transcriptional ArsR family regulator
MSNKNKIQPGWFAGESVLFEMDIWLSFMSGYWRKILISDTRNQLIKEIPSELIAEFRTLVTDKPQLIWIFSKLGYIFGLSEETDYKKVGLYIRKLSFEDVYKKFSLYFAKFSIKTNSKISAQNGLIDLLFKQYISTNQEFRFPIDESKALNEAEFSVTFLDKILSGGQQNYDYWHWQDRMFYEYYYPWRQNQKSIIDEQYEFCGQHLENTRSLENFPPLEWLKERCPLVCRPHIIKGMKKNLSYIHFMVTPYDYFDFMLYMPGYVCLSVANIAWENSGFQNNVERVTKIIKALSDPTRFFMLRCIRKSGMYTTELAAYLNLSQPTVSEHCKILRNAGLIETYQEGRKSLHILKHESLPKLYDQINYFLEIKE